MSEGAHPEQFVGDDETVDEVLEAFGDERNAT